MKAKVKETGEIIDVEPFFYAKINSTDPMIHKNDIELIEPNADIDWEQRRYEISKAMIAAFMSNSDKMYLHTLKKIKQGMQLNMPMRLLMNLKKKKDETE